MTADFRELQRGIVTVKRDAAFTIYIKWTRVVTATTDRVFEIHLEDGRVLIGSLAASQTAYRVMVRGTRDTMEVPIGSVVEMTVIEAANGIMPRDLHAQLEPERLLVQPSGRATNIAHPYHGSAENLNDRLRAPARDSC